jgi:myo-inositol-1(or 4)-monophosphatase
VPTLLRKGGFRSQRNLGSVALEWCWIAAGRYQLYLHGGQKLWDYAAGRLIASEAGVPSRLYRPFGTAPAEGLDLGPRLAVAAANPALLDQWLDFIDLPLTPA